VRYLGAPTSTSAMRKIENVAVRAGANGARIRIWRELCYRNQISVLILVHNNSISRAGVGDHFRSPADAVWNSCLGRRGHQDGGTKVYTGTAGPHSVYNRSITEKPLSLALLGRMLGFQKGGAVPQGPKHDLPFAPRSSLRACLCRGARGLSYSGGWGQGGVTLGAAGASGMTVMPGGGGDSPTPRGMGGEGGRRG
jgi:hypothetical protein